MASGKQWVIAISDLPPKQTANSNIDANIISLLHPRTNRKTPFLFVGTKIYELQTGYPMLGEENGYASWFVGDSVISDGSLVIATPIDPLFLALSFLCTSTRMRPSDQLFLSEKAPESKRIGHCKDLNLKHICDVNDQYGPDSIFYRYNEEKTISWLQLKIKNLIKQLDTMSEALDDNNANSGVAKSFVLAGTKNPNIADIDAKNKEKERKMKLYALRFISEYIPNQLLEKLSTIYQISMEEITKRKRTAIRKSPVKPKRKPINNNNEFEDDLDALIRENAGESIQIASPPGVVSRNESTTSIETTEVEPKPQEQRASKWQMQNEVSGDSLRGLLNIAPDFSSMNNSSSKKRSFHNGNSDGKNQVKRAKPNKHLVKASKGTKKLFAFFTKKKN